MPVSDGDIVTYLTGGAGNTDKSASLGGDTSSTPVEIADLNNLFRYVTEDEAEVGGSIIYRAVAIKNTSLYTLYNAVLWMGEPLSAGDVDFAMGVEVGTTQEVTDEETAPDGVDFSSPLTKATGIVLGDWTPGAEIRLWTRRTANADAVILADSCEVYIEGGNAPSA
jgi:hypothetical protein